MEEYFKNELRLIECYRGSDNKEECQKYADEMKKFISDGGFNTSTALKDLWKQYYKTKQYYSPIY